MDSAAFDSSYGVLLNLKIQLNLNLVSKLLTIGKLVSESTSFSIAPAYVPLSVRYNNSSALNIVFGVRLNIRRANGVG